MHTVNKDKILTEARNHLNVVMLRLKQIKINLENAIKKSQNDFRKLSAADQFAEKAVMIHNTKQAGEIEFLKKSPYFARCDVMWEDEKDTRSIYIGKYSLSGEGIYSWIVPAAVMRFENPGAVEYTLPEGGTQKAILSRKDQYMIVGGDIKFMTTESIDNPRELVYQEYFSNRKQGFVLPEIVAQMEKAQDQVIRAHHVGPFLIAGPAGSGKTTLALHRVAYLVQAPDISDSYPSHSIIVFVQDSGTKEYFSHLLPELGIDDIQITTFAEWALSVLNSDCQYTIRYGDSESTRDRFEFSKLKALNNTTINAFNTSNVYTILDHAYHAYLDETQIALFKQQKKEHKLDRIDCTILLKSYLNTNGKIGTIDDYWERLKNGSMRKKKGFIPFRYSLAVIDEFQNYLPEQLKLIKSCMDKNQSILYVGDMAQQVLLGTLRDWEDIGETISDDRKVVLQKVYRSTKGILRYIKALGYNIEIPEGLREGIDVTERALKTTDDEIEYIKNVTDGREYATIGILSKDPAYLLSFKHAFASNKKIHTMTMNEAQGVEFDIVFLVGITANTFNISQTEGESDDLVKEKKRINKDLLYVALTRAISDLHVIGEMKLSTLEVLTQ